VEVVITMSTGERPRGRRGRGAKGRRSLLPRISVIFMAAGWLLAASGAQAAGPEVVVLPTTGIVDGTMAKYLDDSITQAQERGATAVIVKLNTPGGELGATYDIDSILLEAPLPVIVWVAPAGGFAASAGTYITMSANIALMAPGTRIGAASPISGEGTDIEGTLGRKVLNDAIAAITEIATVRHRNVEWAVQAVRDARSSPATEAAELGVVDGLATTLDDVLAFANGKTVEVHGQPRVLDLAGASLNEQSMNPFLSIFRLLADPTIVALLFSTGSIGLLAELYSPNFVTGILGGLMILLALIGAGTLPLNVGGLLLLVFGIVLFGLELTVTSHGLLGFGGVVCVALGLSALFTGPTDPFQPLVQVAVPVIVVISATGAALVGLITFGVIRSRRAGIGLPIGAHIAAGATGEVRSPLSPVGSVIAAGEEWSAKTADGRSLDRGTPIRVIKVEGLTLTVEPDASSSKGT
jgi:membrane-bound serine protease (ClpP class)